ncbi:MDR family MFS transporter [Streptomyces sp. NPDC019396]|uniref:MDR family MFS transporter n=1 Tax=Streptomyces sp. NPDC019396 TaxID=3154687 RepID=UPI0033D7841B
MTVEATSEKADAKLDRPLLILGAVMSVGTFAAALDATIVSLALDSIRAEFSTPLETIQWIITGYLLGIATVIPVTGWAIDRFGSRTMWLTAMGLFLAASLFCGFAWSAPVLIASRVVQGFGGGMIVPIAQAILARAAGPSRVGRTMALVTIPTQFASVIGPTLGGLLVETTNWRWIFYINLPVCLAAGLLAAKLLPRDEPEGKARLDLTGLLLLSPGLALLVFGVSRITGGGSGVVTPMLIGAVLLAGYVVHALRTPHPPIIDLRLFSTRWFRTLAALMAVYGAFFFGAVYLFPLYFQEARGHSTLQAGLDVAPNGIGLLLMLFLGGTLADKLGPRPAMLAGLGTLALGTLVYTQLPADPPVWLLWIALAVRGAGVGLCVGPLMAAVFQGGLPKASIPRATTSINILQRVGGSFGTALFAVVLQSQAGQHAPTAADFSHTFWWVTGLIALALVLTWSLPRGRPAEAAADH